MKEPKEVMPYACVRRGTQEVAGGASAQTRAPLTAEQFSRDNMGWKPEKLDVQFCSLRKAFEMAEAYAYHVTAALRIERDQLKGWKESAMSVMPDYQEIGKLLGVRLGDSVHDKIVSGIVKLRERAEQAERERDHLREAIDQIAIATNDAEDNPHRSCPKRRA